MSPAIISSEKTSELWIKFLDKLSFTDKYETEELSDNLIHLFECQQIKNNAVNKKLVIPHTAKFLDDSKKEYFLPISKNVRLIISDYAFFNGKQKECKIFFEYRHYVIKNIGEPSTTTLPRGIFFYQATKNGPWQALVKKNNQNIEHFDIQKFLEQNKNIKLQREIEDFDYKAKGFREIKIDPQLHNHIVTQCEDIWSDKSSCTIF